MAGLFELGNEIAVLSGGRRAEWKAQTVAAIAQGLGNGIPAIADAGADLGGSLKTLVVLDLRADPAFRQCKITVPVPVSLIAVYGVEIDGTRVLYDAGGAGAADLQDVLEGIRDALIASGPINALVESTVIDADADLVDDTVLIKGRTAAHFSFEASPLTGPAVAGILLGTAEPELVDLRVWTALAGIANNARPAAWRMVNGGEFLGLDAVGFVERFDTASFSRLYLELDQVTGSGDGAAVVYTLGAVVVAPSKLP